jgi:hypothetical protein
MPDGHPCEFPTGDGYLKRTMATINEAQKHIKLPSLPIPRDEFAMPISAVSNMTFTPTQPLTAPLPLPIAAVLGMLSYPIMSIYPPNESLVLDGGDSDLSQDSNDLVSMPISFFLPHLIWECAVDSHDPSSLSCVPISASIDHGSPPVLIDQALVFHLCLPTCALSQLFPVSGAFFNDSSNSSHVSLIHWVKLKLHDRNNCILPVLSVPSLHQVFAMKLSSDYLFFHIIRS